jgi:pantetheine-phosphate adenylyltransferase
MQRVAIFPGSFDPFTKGHEAVVEEALKLFDKVVVAIGHNIQKRGFLTVDARKALIERVYKDNPRVEVTTYTTLTGDEARRMGATAIVRSVRNMTDFDYERTIANANRFAYKELSTVIVLVPVEVEHISSSLVRELHAFGRDVEGLMPEGIELCDYINFEE